MPVSKNPTVATDDVLISGSWFAAHSDARGFERIDSHGEVPNVGRETQAIQCPTSVNPRFVNVAASVDEPARCEPDTLAELIAEGGNLLEDLVDMFQAELPRGLAELERAFDTGDCAGVARVAHTLKGTAGTFGAKRMHALAERIDLLARAKRNREAAALFDEFLLECQLVLQHLQLKVQTQD